MAQNLPKDVAYAKEWLAFEEQTGGRFVFSGSALDIRKQFAEQFATLKAMLPPPGPEVITEEHHTSKGVPVRVYKPAGSLDGLPIGLYIHSGGWACGSVEGEDFLARQLFLTTPCILVSPEYRLAPEHPFPAGPEDCASAYMWMAEEASDLGGDRSKLFLVGGSAGGSLSLSTALQMVGTDSLVDKMHAPKAVFALCPATYMLAIAGDLPSDLQQFNHPDAYPDSASLDKVIVSTCEAAYTGNADPSNELLSPVLSPKLKDLPFVYMTTSNKDPLNDDAFMFQHAFQSAGGKGILKEYNGYPHFFHMLPHLEASQKLMADLAEAIREYCK